MKIAPAMIEIFLRSSGAPPAMLDLFRLIQAEGLSAFAFKPVAKDDPNWASIGSDAEGKNFGIWLRAEGPNSRVTAAIFFEGVNDETLQLLAGVTGVPAALPPVDRT